MNKNDKRICLAKFEGWTITHSEKFEGVSPENNGKDEALISIIPDYFNDLNAIHKVELKLNNYDYAQVLSGIIKLQTGSCRGFYECIIATADQRAEAICKLIGILS